MSKYFLHGKLTATKGNGASLADILIEAAQLLSDAPGCHLYLVSRDENAPEDVWVTEVWNTKADHDQSLQNPNVRALITKAMPMLAGPPAKGQELQLAGGLGLPS